MVRKNVVRVLMVIAILFLVSGCATFGALTGSMDNMTPAQKYDAYRTTFNDVIDFQYYPWAMEQPESTRVLLRTDVNPKIKRVKEALDIYGKELKTPGGDPNAKMNFYLGLKKDLFDLILKYGLKIDESKVKVE